MKKYDRIWIAGLLLYAVAFFTDRVVYQMPRVLFLTLAGISIALMAAGIIGDRLNRRHKQP